MLTPVTVDLKSAKMQAAKATLMYEQQQYFTEMFRPVIF